MNAGLTTTRSETQAKATAKANRLYAITQRGAGILVSGGGLDEEARG